MCVRIVRNGTQSQPSQSTPSSPVSIVIGRRPQILSNFYSSSSTEPSELLREIRFYDRTQLGKNFSVKMERKSTHIILSPRFNLFYSSTSVAARCHIGSNLELCTKQKPYIFMLIVYSYGGISLEMSYTTVIIEVHQSFKVR